MPLLLFVPFLFFARLVSLFSFSPLALEIYQSLEQVPSTQLLSVLCCVYGVTQALFQYPWARLSDSIPRIILIRSLLLIFAFASLGCYFAATPLQLIVFRALQGLCALQAVVQAYMSDYYKEDELKRAMLFVGIAVTLSLIIGYGSPLFVRYSQYSPQSIFLLSFVFSLLAFIASFYLRLPQPLLNNNKYDGKNLSIFSLNLYPFAINFSIHLLHSFIIIMVTLLTQSSLSTSYLPLLLLSFIIASPGLSPRQNSYAVLRICSFVGLVNLFLLPLSGSYFYHVILLFNFSLLLILEASMPSIILSYHKQHPKGYLMGINSFIQYIGMAFGFYCAPFAVATNTALYAYFILMLVFITLLLRLCYFVPAGKLSSQSL